LIEAALLNFWDRGYFDRHLQKLQQALDERYSFCLSALKGVNAARGFVGRVQVGGPILAKLPKRVPLDELAERRRSAELS